MTATAEPPPVITFGWSAAEEGSSAALGRARGIELLGPVHASGYKEGVSLVRRADGQIVQLGPLMYGLLECLDGQTDTDALAVALSRHLGRRVGPAHVMRLAGRLAGLGLLAGSEHNAPPRRNPLLAMRWKVLMTDPATTRRLTAPVTFLFRPGVMWPLLVAFVAVSWFVLIHKGVAAATVQAFHSPGLLLLVFALSVVSAAFHELGHAAACRYAGAEPGGMGMGIYLVWPAFYTDVTDAYRLPRRDRLRIDLAGLYFNAVVAVLTMVGWLLWRVDALLLLVAVQILQMVKQLSPVIRADGYHILSDATGIPDLYAHVGPTLRRLLPGHRHEPTALRGKARLLVTLWVLIVVPVLLSLMLGAVVLLPHLAATAWQTGGRIIDSIPHQAADLQLLELGASALRLLALLLPVAGSALVTQKVLRSTLSRAREWTAGHPARRTVMTVAGAGCVALLIWAWWPSGQYQPIRGNHGGTLPQLLRLDAGPAGAPPPVDVAQLTPGSHLVAAMVPLGGATPTHPAVFLGPAGAGRSPAEVVSFGNGATQATAFPFALPGPPGPGDTQALALGTTDRGVTYDVAYGVLTVSGGNPVTDTNSAYAIADCRACTTVAVSFQVVLVVGQSDVVSPMNGAAAINYKCLACTTTALADQMVVTLRMQPSQQLTARLDAALAQLNLLSKLGAAGTPAAIAGVVDEVQNEVTALLAQSGLVAGQPTTVTTMAGSGAGTTTTQPSPSAPGTTATTTSAGSSTTGTDTSTTTTAAPS
ncbi:MAG TPA: hypothetical protein VKI19_04880, partial [Acidimicrobiales bacterium]|nr:hypothetical protein [Acidimicrobiales bacterium]